MTIAGLRPASPGDRPAIEALVPAAYGPYVAEFGQCPGPMQDDYGALVAAHRVQVVERAGHILGLLVLIPQPDALLLDNIAVAPALHGQGLGRTLLTRAEAQARALGHTRIRLYTHEKMTRNRRIYAAAGYHETHRVTERGLPRVYMEKPL
ncbi:MAG: GNAT family N-acetyltransferase [Rhodobacter sp.]|uniref:GNAT family N-acetyltransferase n=1 Tax=Pararhodobacter sp. TaxID=2127056 RepID=UPI002B94C3B1|nr:GNAT family N-acetyltransferase [Pararhodobacter sp.]MCC0074802.1 GNAT family N-acetyltransferase [Rhodobacter sp.]HPD93899.1 GNAT family N-acetyltransferase [Pararhodobacter sp.]